MKNRIKYLIFFVVIISLYLSSCRDNKAHKLIYINNNSDKAVYYGISHHYPDTSLQRINQFPGENGNITHKINSKAQSDLLAAEFAYNPTIQLFMFDADVIEHEPMDSIVTHYKVLKRYHFAESDMEIANWTITYP